MQIKGMIEKREIEMDFNFSSGKNLSLKKALSSEWLETNGLGGYASSTIINCHTRKYHGLLVCSLDNSSNKSVLLSKIEDKLLLEDEGERLLSAAQYLNHFNSADFEHYHHFELNTHPKFTYKFGKFELVKEILMPYEENSVLIKYKLPQGNKFKIKIRPLFAMRGIHELAKENTCLKQNSLPLSNGQEISFYKDMPRLYLQSDVNYIFAEEPLWYYNFEYEQERARGFDCHEDLFTHGVITISGDKNREAIFYCGMKPCNDDLSKKWVKEINRRGRVMKKTNGSPLQKQLKKTGISFVKKNLQDRSLSIIAGYHWFGEWGRDTMISLPGLTLYSGLEKQCLAILKKFSSNEQKGLIPNFLGGSLEENAYNSVDASLWFAWAVQQYYLKTKDTKAIKTHLWATLKNIFLNYKNGTSHNIKMNKLGLIEAGCENVNLTWMDAIVDGRPVTPRYGMAVEVNALWFNMLCFIDELATLFDDGLKKEIAPLIKLTKSSFGATFWNDELGCLKDCVNAKEHNTAIRPNQIFAVSLPNSAVTKKMALSIVKVVKEHLLTLYGLRTLSNKDANYIGHYYGDVKQRDFAYHNGTVWPWLIGHFGEALLKVSRDRQRAVKMLQNCLEALLDHLAEVGIGSISEVFDGEPPYRSNGCVSQAWSVAEVLRLTYLIDNM